MRPQGDWPWPPSRAPYSDRYECTATRRWRDAVPHTATLPALTLRRRSRCASTGPGVPSPQVLQQYGVRKAESSPVQPAVPELFWGPPLDKSRHSSASGVTVSLPQDR